MLDHKLKRDLWTDLINTKTQQSVDFLKTFNVQSKIRMYYCAFIQSVLSFSIHLLVWKCFCGPEKRNANRKTVTTARKSLRIAKNQVYRAFKERMVSKANKIRTDKTLLLNHCFSPFPSGRRFFLPLFY